MKSHPRRTQFPKRFCQENQSLHCGKFSLVLQTMPRDLIKLESGIVHTPEFADHLKGLHAREAPRHRGEVLSLDYVRCGSGPQEGSEWLQITWIPLQGAPRDSIYQIGIIPLFLHRQSFRGLRGRGLHAENGQISVLS
jgi:hypothetical protein